MTELDPRALITNSGALEPKLSEAERGAILALRHAGVRVPVLAAAFNVNRRTVTHMCNPSSPYYKALRKKRNEMGPEKFDALYRTEEMVLRVNAVVNTPETKAKYADSEAGKSTLPNPNATSKQGEMSVKSFTSGEMVRVNIQFLSNGPFGPGWYWNVVAAVDSDEFGPFLTSFAAYEDAGNNV